MIGGGSSSIQIVPNLQKIEGVKMTCFVRSRTWISNSFGDQAMVKLGLDPKKLDCRSHLTGVTERANNLQFLLSSEENLLAIPRNCTTSARSLKLTETQSTVSRSGMRLTVIIIVLFRRFFYSLEETLWPFVLAPVNCRI